MRAPHLLIGLLVLASPALAAAETDDKGFGISSASKAGGDKGAENWDGSVTFSASSATGNTQNTVLGLSFEARRVLGRYTHDVSAAANFARTSTENDDGSTNTETTQNNWFGQYRLEMQVADRTYAYGRFRWEQNQFSGFENRVFFGGGVGHTVIEQEGLKWDVLAGPGVQYTQLEEPDPVPADFEQDKVDAAVYLGSDIKWVIRENVEFEHDFDVTYADINTSVATQLALKTKLTERLSSRVSYSIKYETDPPAGRENTDTLLQASLAYGF